MEYFQAESKENDQMMCCDCGTIVPSNPTNLCVACLRKQVDISSGIPKTGTLYFCRNCERYLNPPDTWIHADFETKELMNICINKVKGIDKSVRLVDAGFIWTEPHSKRIKLKVTIQKEIEKGAVLQQTFVVEFTVHNQMCGDCHRVEAKDYWSARVQVRTRTSHKKTLLYLEQLIIKHRADIETNTTNITQVHEGLDFQYQHQKEARKMVDFLETVIPCRSALSKELISHDIRSQIYNYKFSYSVEVVPLCKDNIVCLPLQLARKLGNISQLCIVNRITQVVQLIDPRTKRISELTGSEFWKYPFSPLCHPKQLVEYIIDDVEIVGAAEARCMKPLIKKEGSAARHQGVESEKHALADVMIVRASEYGVGDQIICRTHLGHLLKPGDSALGFDLRNANINDYNLEGMNPEEVPDVILVKKVYGDRTKRARKRNWKLKHLNKEETESEQGEYNEFLEDLEEDEETRKNVNIYRAPKSGNVGADETDDDTGAPMISLAEMLDELSISRDATGEAGADMMMD